MPIFTDDEPKPNLEASALPAANSLEGFVKSQPKGTKFEFLLPESRQSARPRFKSSKEYVQQVVAERRAARKAQSLPLPNKPN